MSFDLVITDEAEATLNRLKAEAERSIEARQAKKMKKSSKAEGLYKQVVKCLSFLAETPRHRGLQTHIFTSMDNPYDPKEKVFEAYAQNRTPGAYRVFWCYGPEKDQITIIAITPHP